MASGSAEDRDEQKLTERPEPQSDLDARPTHVDAPASDAATTTPRSAIPPISIEVVEASTEREASRAAPARRSGEDTLLSLPAPADGAPEPEPRVIELERRVQQLEARLAVLEVGGKSGKRWLAWIAFMVTLAVAWQVVRQLR